MISSNNSKTFCVYLVLCLITACSSPLKKVQELAGESLYDQAIADYNQLPANDKATLDIATIKNQRQKYEQDLISDIEQLIHKQEFFEAQKKIDEGMRSIPLSEQLNSVDAKLVQYKKIYTKKYQAIYDLEYAQYLIKERPVLEKLKRVKANEKDFYTLYKSRSKDRLIYSGIIGKQGLRAIETPPPSIARELLTIAQQLDEDERWQDALNTILKKERSEKAKYEQAAKENKQHQHWQRKERIKRLKVDFYSDFNKGDLLVSRSHLKEIQLLDITDIKWIQKAQKAQDKAIEKKLEDALFEGQHYYSTGEIAIAIKVWKKALAFSPTDKRLNENIQRAERFEEKLEQLTQPD